MKHGANIYKYAKKIKCKPDEIIDFSSNINLYNPDINIDITPQMVTKYPDSKYKKLKKTISKKYNVNQSQIALFNGATSAIMELLKVLKEKRVYLYAPIYGEYEKASSDKKIIKIDRFYDISSKVKKNSIVIFVNPSTPDGKYYNLKKLFRYWKKQKCTIILDESFLAFEKLKSFRNKINKYKKLYILQSFTKFYGCAGVRVGAIFSHKKNIKKFQIPLWNISAFDSIFLTQRLKDKQYKKQTYKLHKKQKKELYKILKNSKLFQKIYNSDSNFFLTKVKKTDLFNKLLENKILVRTCESFDYLDSSYLRFAVKGATHHKILKDKIEVI
jgi:threonine-phosphate decarboxylase